jgi:hypothetical protein
MATDATYGETLEIMAAAAAFGVNISVHVGQRRHNGRVIQEEMANHYLCGTVGQRHAAGLPPHVHGRIYLHSTDGQSHYQWRSPAPLPVLLPPPIPRPPLPPLSPPGSCKGHTSHLTSHISHLTPLSIVKPPNNLMHSTNRQPSLFHCRAPWWRNA